MEAEKFVLPQPYQKVLLTVGEFWGDLIDREIKSAPDRYAHLFHLNFASPNFTLSRHDHLRFRLVQAQMKEFLQKTPSMDAATQNLNQEVQRFNSRTLQASEVIFRCTVAAAWSDVICVDNALLDTGLGQYVMSEGARMQKPVWGLGVDSRNAVLAPAFVRGILYPLDVKELFQTILGMNV